MAKAKQNQSNIFSKNKKAYFDYEILEKIETGIVLTGEEVKSIRNNQANLKGAFIDIENNEPFLNEAHISRYKFSSNKNYNPKRKRKLLLRKNQIPKINQAINEKGKTVIPLELYKKNGLIKMLIGIGRGKKLHDKRETLKRRAQEKEIKQKLKNF